MLKLLPRTWSEVSDLLLILDNVRGGGGMLLFCCAACSVDGFASSARAERAKGGSCATGLAFATVSLGTSGPNELVRKRV